MTAAFHSHTSRLRCHPARFLLPLLLTALGCQTASSPPRPLPTVLETQPIPIVVQYLGSDCALTEPSVKLITSTTQLQSMHCAALVAQLEHEIQFARYSLLLLTLGEQGSSGYWCQITAVQHRTGVLYVQGIANRPAPDQPVAQVVTYPYAVAIIPNLGVDSIHAEIVSVTGAALPQP